MLGEVVAAEERENCGGGGSRREMEGAGREPLAWSPAAVSDMVAGVTSWGSDGWRWPVRWGSRFSFHYFFLKMWE